MKLLFLLAFFSASISLNAMQQNEIQRLKNIPEDEIVKVGKVCDQPTCQAYLATLKNNDVIFARWFSDEINGFTIFCDRVIQKVDRYETIIPLEDEWLIKLQLIEKKLSENAKSS